MAVSDRLTPLRHRRATGETRLGTSSNPVAESDNPAVKRFARGGAVEGRMPKHSEKIDTDYHPGKDDGKMKRGGHAHKARGGHLKHKAKGGPTESAEDFPGVGADAAADMRGGSLAKGDEFKKGGKAKHKYATGGHVHHTESAGSLKHSGGKFTHPEGHKSHSEHHRYAEGGHVTRGVNKW